MKTLAALTIISCLLGALGLIVIIVDGLSAPQQAAGAAIAIGAAVIPYCFLRACDLFNSDAPQDLSAIRKTMEVHTRLLAEIANRAANELRPPE